LVETVNGLGSDSLTPLEYAALYGDLPVAKWLLANKAVVRTGQFFGTTLHVASREGHLEIVDS